MASAVRRRSYPKRKCNSQVFGGGSRVDGRRWGSWAGRFPRFRTRTHSSRVHLPIGGISRARGWALRGALVLCADRLESRPALCELTYGDPLGGEGGDVIRGTVASFTMAEWPRVQFAYIPRESMPRRSSPDLTCVIPLAAVYNVAPAPDPLGPLEA